MDLVVDTRNIPTKSINNVLYKFIFDETTGAKHLVMRIAEVPPGGRVPMHSHDDEEQAYLILEGEGTVVLGADRYRVREGYAVFIPLNTPHEVINDGRAVLRYVFFNAKIEVDHK